MQANASTLHSIESLHYELPSELIAKKPVEPRDACRLLQLNKVDGRCTHHHFYNLPNLLQPGDVLVRNVSKVIPARLAGTKATGGHVEVLLNRLLNSSLNIWECLLRPSAKTGTVLTFSEQLSGEIISTLRDSFTFEIKFNCEIDQFYFLLNSVGKTPLPPYIKQAELHSENYWRSVYQTTFAINSGSVAAPTAGLHFTTELDDRLRETGVTIEEITLHVGLGTFAPIRTDDYRNHVLHSEDFTLTSKSAAVLNKAKRDGNRIIAVGTTTVRVLEYCANMSHQTCTLQAQSGSTNYYIYPPYKFKFVDGIITNFHLPETSLLLLVSAFASSPNTTHHFSTFDDSIIGQAYQEAITQKYRFFSFGDAMFIS